MILIQLYKTLILQHIIHGILFRGHHAASMIKIRSYKKERLDQLN